jgi:hypothetical protein
VPDVLTSLVVVNAVVDVVNPDMSVYKASLKVDPPDESKLNVPFNRSVLKESGITLAIFLSP